MKEEILSVGIDIGTSTTQLVFSKITLENLATSFSVPRIKIVDKNIVYKSNIYFTPLIKEKNIDMDEVIKIVDKEYSLAKINKKDIKVGAVIITGETARKENANEVLHKLSGYAGDFVVATAGPDLESIIAGRGAGTDIFSKENNTLAVNIDIGGGTSNLSLFNRGEVYDTGCLDIGGRLIKIDTKTLKVYYINEKIKELIALKNIDIKLDETIKKEEAEKLCEEMVKLLEMSVGIRTQDEFFQKIITNKSITKLDNIKHISFSGGVAEYIYNPSYDDIFRYGDVGIMLANKILNSGLVKKLNLVKANETIRATVVGAGSHTTEISGSTINYTENVFPIKNIPILKLSSNEEETEEMSEAIKEKLKWFNLGIENDNVAISFEGKKSPSFLEITKIAQAIIDGADDIIKRTTPLVVIVERDMAKVLGQTISNILNYKKDILCIDGIRVENGDYVDIGKPLAEGKVVPVVVKTLIFK